MTSSSLFIEKFPKGIRLSAFEGEAPSFFLADPLVRPCLGDRLDGSVTHATVSEYWVSCGFEKPALLRKTKHMLPFTNGQPLRVECVREPMGDKSARVLLTHEEPRALMPQWLRALNHASGEIMILDTDLFQEAKAAYPEKKIVLNTTSSHKEKLDRAWEEALEPRIPLEGGGYAVLDEVEALSVFDINTGEGLLSGPIVFKTESEKEAYLKQTFSFLLNKIQFLDLAGIILIDFPRLSRGKNLDLLTKVFKEEARVFGIDVLGFTRAGLLELTRPVRHLSLRKRYDLIQGKTNG